MVFQASPTSSPSSPKSTRFHHRRNTAAPCLFFQQWCFRRVQLLPQAAPNQPDSTTVATPQPLVCFSSNGVSGEPNFFPKQPQIDPIPPPSQHRSPLFVFPAMVFQASPTSSPSSPKSTRFHHRRNTAAPCLFFKQWCFRRAQLLPQAAPNRPDSTTVDEERAELKNEGEVCGSRV
ncbi:hypothetical protein L1987_04401 [Smallanthus sonchifolius]|uniref:Uncharacterized protein n=1 Tax=Smallanthus sonchifolius TaxID=185202 RepID=A0ACB9KDB1_9ASTR|nr:hypothetical protein L1987_04401 [Smallanthus sonchifolius]